jgi:hypothetical protein
MFNNTDTTEEQVARPAIFIGRLGPARWLRPEEYPRLHDIFVAQGMEGVPSPEIARIAVVEGEAGVIVAFVVLQQVLHLEPFWTHPASPGAWKQCLKLVEEHLEGTGLTVYTSINRQPQERILGKLGWRGLGLSVMAKTYSLAGELIEYLRKRG